MLRISTAVVQTLCSLCEHVGNQMLRHSTFPPFSLHTHHWMRTTLGLSHHHHFPHPSGTSLESQLLHLLGEGVNDGQGDEPLFSLATVKGRGAVGRIAEEETPDAPEDILMSSDSEGEADAAAPAGSDEESGDDNECVSIPAHTTTLALTPEDEPCKYPMKCCIVSVSLQCNAHESQGRLMFGIPAILR